MRLSVQRKSTTAATATAVASVPISEPAPPMTKRYGWMERRCDRGCAELASMQELTDNTPSHHSTHNSSVATRRIVHTQPPTTPSSYIHSPLPASLSAAGTATALAPSSCKSLASAQSRSWRHVASPAWQHDSSCQSTWRAPMCRGPTSSGPAVHTSTHTGGCPTSAAAAGCCRASACAAG